MVQSIASITSSFGMFYLCCKVTFVGYLWSIYFVTELCLKDSMWCSKWPPRGKAQVPNTDSSMAVTPSLERNWIIFLCKIYFFNAKGIQAHEVHWDSGEGPAKYWFHLIFLLWIYCAMLFMDILWNFFSLLCTSSQTSTQIHRSIKALCTYTYRTHKYTHEKDIQH